MVNMSERDREYSVKYDSAAGESTDASSRPSA